MDIAVISLIIIAFLLAFCVFLMIRNKNNLKPSTQEIRENFPQPSPMNVMYSDASGNLATSNDVGLKYLTISSDGALVLDGSGSGSGNVKDQLADLYAKIRELSATIASNKTATDNSIANLRSELSSTISANKTAVDNRISSVISDLNASIDKKASSSDTSTSLTTLGNRIKYLEENVTYTKNFAKSCNGWACNEKGAICSPGATGAGGNTFVCNGSKWINVAE